MEVTREGGKQGGGMEGSRAVGSEVLLELVKPRVVQESEKADRNDRKNSETQGLKYRATGI